jgi:polyhydroxybutyrate depolymerase
MAAGPCERAPAPGSFSGSYVSGGFNRRVIVHVPPAVAGRALPVVLALAGANQSSEFFERYTGLSALADGEQFIAVYPTATGLHPLWTINDDHPGAANDVVFLSGLLDGIGQRLCVDPSRIYSLGVSNGGGMTARLACELSGRIAAVVSVAGGYRSLPPCHPDVPVSVLEIHGTADPDVRYLGSGGGGPGAVGPFLSGWAARNGCRARPRRRRVGVALLRLDWTGCRLGADVSHIEVFGGGHQLPGGLPHDRGPRSTFSAVWEAWRFLRAHARAPGPYALPATPYTLPRRPGARRTDRRR